MKYENIVRYAKENVPFYRNLDPCEDIPYIDKVTIANNIEDFICEKYKGILKKQLLAFQTSGTTGQPSLIYWNENDLLLRQLNIEHLNSYTL